jgi:hypothetical protein
MNAAEKLPAPPRLHWIIVLLLTIVTVGLFADVWMIVQAWWVRKFDKKSRALALCIAGIVATALTEVLNETHAGNGFVAVVGIGSLALDLVASFSLRDSLAWYITSLTRKPTYLSGMMTIFFGPIYFQYHMNKVRRMLK